MGITTGGNVSFVSVYAGTETAWDEASSAFRAENTLSLVRVGFAIGKVSLTTEYAQALSDWDKGSFSLMVGVGF